MRIKPPNILSDNQSLNINQLDTYIQSAISQWDIPGLSLAIVKDNKTVVTKGYGLREAGKSLPVDEHTLFPINGGTRLFTVSALALLVAEGQLSWNDRLTDVLPWFKTGSELVNREATVIDALAWRIGFPHELLTYWPNPGLSRRELLDKLRHITAPSSFRNGQAVSSLLFIAAGEIIPALTGISWGDFVRDRLFAPLGMTNSLTGPHLLEGGDNVVSPHAELEGQQVIVPRAMTSNMGPANSIYSNAADMAKWLQFQLDSGKAGEQLLIPKAQIDQMRKIHQTMSIGLPGCITDLDGCGLGASVLTSHGGHRVYSVGSDTEGCEAYYGFIPELNLGIAAMVNAHYGLPQRLVPWVIDRYTGAPETDWVASLSCITEKRALKKLTLDKQREQLTDSSRPASLPLAAYVGIYQHPYLGNIAIREDKAGLAFTFGETYEGSLVHTNNHTFFREPVKPMFCRVLFGGPLRFNLSYEGQVESITITEGEFFKNTNQ